MASVAAATFPDRTSLDSAYTARLSAAAGLRPGGAGEARSADGSSRSTTLVNRSGKAEIDDRFDEAFVLITWIGPDGNTKQLTAARTAATT